MATQRIKSIDIIRGFAIFVMIFCNDLWSLSNIPEWLPRKGIGQEGMGLGDFVFSTFLFIVGLSIPYAIKSRRKKGHAKIRIVKHISERTLALLIMGLFFVNKGYIDSEDLLILPQIWQVLMVVAFFMIWNSLGERVLGWIPNWAIKATGVAILIFLAAIYVSEGEEGYRWMRIYWWGILGVIGWGYMLSALVYLFIGNRPGWIAMVLGILLLLNVNEFVTPLNFNIRLVTSAAHLALVMCGMFVTSVMIYLKEQNKMQYLIPFLVILGAVLISFGFLTRPVWGIIKNLATPSWMTISAGAAAILFAIMYLVIDKLGYTRWSDLVKPAGEHTLTAYLLPNIVAISSAFALPVFLSTGLVGILKSMLIALFIIQLTRILGKYNLTVKI